MKIAKIIMKYLWYAIIGITLLFYCFSCFMGYQVKKIAVSSIESMGTKYVDFEDKIYGFDYEKLWHETPDNASFDRTQIQEQRKTQKYTVSNPEIIKIDGVNQFKIGYVYNIHIYDKSGEETTAIAQPNSKVVLNIKIKNGSFLIESVLYDNDFNEYSVGSYFYESVLIILLLINAVVRNIKYFDYCVINKCKKNVLRYIQPYIFVVLLILAAIFDILPIALIIGIIEELAFTIIYFILKHKKSSD